MLASLLETACDAAGRADWSAAALACQEVLQQSPGSLQATCLLARLARLTGNPAQAELLLRERLTAERGLGAAELWLELGLSLRDRQQLGAAAQALEQAAIAAPRAAVIWNDLAAVSLELEQFERASQCARRAIALDATSASARINLATALGNLGQAPAAIALLQHAVQLEPNNALAHWNLSLALLRAGEFAAGWDHYQWREAAGQVALDQYAQPPWDGSPLGGRRLLIHGEQGLGDEILFASCYRELIAEAQGCVLVCDPRLAPLFRRAFPNATVVGHQRRKDRAPASIPFDVQLQVPAGSLPRYLRRRPDDFPRPQSFLEADAAAVGDWVRRYEALGPGCRVGVSWRAGGRASEHRKRTTRLADWQPLFELSDIHWINLQYGDTSEERAQMAELGVAIHDWPEGDPLIDLDQFAARLLALDLVISVGNATAHLAGALGQEAWILLPRVPGWRWGSEGERSPWYASLSLVRQSQSGTFRPELVQLANRLRARLGQSQVPLTDTSPGNRSATSDGSPRAGASGVGAMHDANTLLRQAVAQHADGRAAEAEALCRQVLALAPRQATALFLQGSIARETGRVQLAIDSLRRSLAADDRAETWCELARAWWHAGRSDEAIAHCRQALARDPHFQPARQALQAWTDASTTSASGASRDVQRTDP